MAEKLRCRCILIVGTKIPMSQDRDNFLENPKLKELKEEGTVEDNWDIPRLGWPDNESSVRILSDFSMGWLDSEAIKFLDYIGLTVRRFNKT